MGVAGLTHTHEGGIHENDSNRDERRQATTLCRMLVMPVKGWFFVIALVLLFFMSLCAVVFAGEPEQRSGYCDLQTGLARTLNLSRAQCESLRQLADQFSNDTASIREGSWRNALS